jgi:hypothetical protein
MTKSQILEEENWTLADNRFTKVGRDYIATLSDLAKSSEGDKRALFNTLTQMSLSEKKSLGLHLPVSIGHGDNSWFYIYPKGKDPYEGASNIELKFATLFHLRDACDFDDLYVIPSAMGAWQAYLYSIAPTLLPTEWHGEYIRRTYLFSLETLERILNHTCSLYERNEFELITERDLIPQVKYKKRKAKVICCYWSDWAGLVRETMSIRYDANQNKILSMDCEKKDVLVPYNCKICL